MKEPPEKKDEIHPALFTFIDFIYAVVFALLVQQSFDEIINKGEVPLLETIRVLTLVVCVFYFLAWDWVLGRLLTLRNPYRSYSRFFWEILIAAFAYGTASAAIKQKLIFLIHFALLLFLGGIWAWRTEHQLTETHDRQELCMIQALQFTGSAITLGFFAWWYWMVETTIELPLVILVVLAILGFILVYEMLVPRQKGISAGPGFPFIRRTNVRRLSRFVFGRLVDFGGRHGG